MFDIRIGTMVPYCHLDKMLPTLNQMGFESYAIHMEPLDPAVSYKDLADKIMPLTEGRPISTIGIYDNTLLDYEKDDSVYACIVRCIQGAHYFNCDTVSLFTGALPGQPLDASLPLFREVFTKLCKLAEDNGVRLAMENCAMGGTRRKAANNLALNGDMWEKLFNEVPSDALGLEWEPAHAMHQLIDPIPQLRKWVHKVFHVHGKDATIAWDVLREHGLIGDHPFSWDRTPGFGDTNWCDIMTILMQNGYTGFVDIEGYHDPVFYDDAEWAAQARSLRYLKDCRGGQEWLPRMSYNGWRTRKP